MLVTSTYHPNQPNAVGYLYDALEKGAAAIRILIGIELGQDVLRLVEVLTHDASLSSVVRSTP
jgi:hypothetical protein